MMRVRHTLALSAFGVSVTLAQSTPGKVPPGVHPVFASAALKAHDPASTRSGVTEEKDHILFFNQTVEDLVAYAYGTLNRHQIVDEPAWIRKDRYDLDVVYHPPDQDHNYRQNMLGALLAERFHLITHGERRVIPVYSLAIAEGGAKLDPPLPGRKMEVHSQMENGEIIVTFVNASLLYLEIQLDSYLDRPMLDQTNLKDSYDFGLSWKYDESRRGQPETVAAIIAAARQQLGFRLAPGNEAARVIAIDRVQRPKLD